MIFATINSTNASEQLALILLIFIFGGIVHVAMICRYIKFKFATIFAVLQTRAFVERLSEFKLPESARGYHVIPAYV